MREIEQAIRVLLHVLAQTLRLKSEARYEEALAYIRKAFGEADLSPRPVAELSPDELVALCRYPRGFECGPCAGHRRFVVRRGRYAGQDGRAAGIPRPRCRRQSIVRSGGGDRGGCAPYRHCAKAAARRKICRKLTGISPVILRCGKPLSHSGVHKPSFYFAAMSAFVRSAWITAGCGAITTQKEHASWKSQVV